MNPVDPKNERLTNGEKIRLIAHWESGRVDRILECKERIEAKMADATYRKEYPLRIERYKGRLAEYEQEMQTIAEGMSVAHPDLIKAGKELAARMGGTPHGG